MNGQRIRQSATAAATYIRITRSQSRVYSHACRAFPKTIKPVIGTTENRMPKTMTSLIGMGK